MDFDKIVEKRKSVRSFKSKKVPWDKVLEAIDAANQGPFAGNHHNLKFIIIENLDKIKKVAAACDQPWVAHSPLLIIVLSGENDLEGIYGERGRIYCRQQSGAAIMTILLKLTDLGIGSCWVGAFEDKEIRRLLGVYTKLNVEAVIATGYEDKKTDKKKKKDLASTIYWENWEATRRPTFFAEPKDPLDIRTGYA